MKSGLPEVQEMYVTVDTGELNLYVAKEMVFSGDIPRIVVFPRRTGERDVGVSNVVD